MSDPITITTTGTLPDSIVTEQEYLEREASRPPIQVISNGETVVTNEKELRTALPKGGPIRVNVRGELPITDPATVMIAGPDTTICGLGKSLTTLASKTANPNNISFYLYAKDITLKDIAFDSGFLNSHCLYGDCFGDISGLTMNNVRIQNCNDGFKYVGDINYLPFSNFVFRNSEVVNFKGKGIWMDIDLLNPVIENFLINGVGTKESHTGIWIGQGILGGRIVNGRIINTGYNGLEVFYAHSYPTKSQLSRDNPHGPGLLISGLEIADIANIACSLAGCKRSVISNIHIRNAGSGVEYIDEITSQDGKPLYSDYNAYGVTVANITGVGITVHRMKRGIFSNHVITNCGNFGCQVYDGADQITFKDSVFTKCGNRMLFSNGATNGTYVGNSFFGEPGDAGKWGFYAYGGSHIFSGNVLRGGLRTGAAGATITVSPGAVANISQEYFIDSQNYRLA